MSDRKSDKNGSVVPIQWSKSMWAGSLECLEVTRAGQRRFSGDDYPSGYPRRRDFCLSCSVSAAQWQCLQIAKNGGEDVDIGIAFRQGDPDITDRDSNLSADFEKFQPNRLALRMSQVRVFQAQSSESM